MAHGKYLSLEEARKSGTISRFCREHPSEGDMQLFDHLLNAMARGGPPDRKIKHKNSDGESKNDR